MINLTLIVDGNYLMQKSVHILHKNKILYSELYNVIERDYETLTKLYPFDKIYFVSDSYKSWRKDYYSEYKGTRKTDSEIDWRFVYQEYDKFKDYLKEHKKNCTLLQIDELEGDDIIGYLITKLNEKQHSVLLMSNDSDLLQLINYDLDLKYMNVMYNSKMSDDRVFIPEHYDLLLKKVEETATTDDIFTDNNEKDYLDFFDSFLNGKILNPVNSEQELFMKIMGHNKDNIKSIYLRGERGIGKIGILKVYELYKQTYPIPIDFNSTLFKERLIEHIKLFKRIKDTDSDKDIMERLIRNLKIVKLDEESSPKHLYEKMKNEINL